MTPDHALHFDPDCEECVYLARPTVIRVAPERSLDAAWVEAEAALPVGWWFEAGSRGMDGYRVHAQRYNGAGTGPLVTGNGSTPAAALDALRRALTADPDPTGQGSWGEP